MDGDTNYPFHLMSTHSNYYAHNGAPGSLISWLSLIEIVPFLSVQSVRQQRLGLVSVLFVSNVSCLLL